MKPWFEREAKIFKFPEPEKKVIQMPNVASYPDFLTGVKDLHNRKDKGEISQDSHDKLYTDLIHWFMKKESFETPWFLRENPELDMMQTPQASQLPPETEVERRRRQLQKLQAKQTTRLTDPEEIEGAIKNIPRYADALKKRIQQYITNRKDKDMIEYIALVTDLIFNIEQNPQKLKGWLQNLNNPKNNFIDPNKLLPKNGQPTLQDLTTIVNDQYTLKIMKELRNLKPEGRSDAGPYEAAVAIMATAISFTRDGEEGIGGDIFYGKRKIEVKTNAGPLFPVKPAYYPKMEYITKFLNKIKFKSPERKGGADGKILSVQQFERMLKNKDKYKKFPFENFIRTVSNAWFGQEHESLVKSLTDPLSFRKAWAKEIFDHYKKIAGHEGVLYINNNAQYAYFINGEQLSDFVDKGLIEYRNMYWTVGASQPRRDYLKFK